MSAMSVAGSEPTTVPAKCPAVRQRHGDALGALDDVVVGQDVAVAIDDEPAAGAPARRLAVALAVGRVVVARAAGRDGARPRGFDAASMLTTAGLMRSATSAKFTSAGQGRRPGPVGLRRRLVRGRARHDRRPVHAAGEDDADEERDDGGKRDA